MLTNITAFLNCNNISEYYRIFDQINPGLSRRSFKNIKNEMFPNF